jgi:hypothetical protein
MLQVLLNEKPFFFTQYHLLQHGVPKLLSGMLFSTNTSLPPHRPSAISFSWTNTASLNHSLQRLLAACFELCWLCYFAHGWLYNISFGTDTMLSLHFSAMHPLTPRAHTLTPAPY